MSQTRDNKLAQDFKGIGPEKIKKIEAQKLEGTYSNGYANSELIEPVPDYFSGSGEIVNFEQTGRKAAKNNCWIILGRDRVDYPHTGYGGRGDTQSGAIYICAGMNSANPHEVQPESLKLDKNNYPEETGAQSLESMQPLKTVRSMHNDASVIYLSQKTDIDSILSLGGCDPSDVWDSSNYSDDATKTQSLAALMGIGKYHVPKAPAPHGAIAIKSDNVRLVGRESIRLQIYPESVNAQGGDRLATYGISLVGSGEPASVQPSVLGYKLVGSYKHLQEALLVLKKSVNLFMKEQMSINSILADHEHVNGPLGLTEMLLPFSEIVKMNNLKMEGIVNMNLNTFTARMGTFLSDYTKPGDKYILSKNVFHD